VWATGPGARPALCSLGPAVTLVPPADLTSPPGARPERLSDPARLRALRDTALLDSPAESVFDRLTELAARALGVPVALVSLVTDDRQFFKSQCGLSGPVAEERGSPLSHSFCQHVVVDRAPLVVSDAREDARVAANLAIPDLGVVAYAGFPLVARAGHVVGSFCAIDTQPRHWSERDLELLEGLAATAMDVVALRSEALAGAEVSHRLQAALVPDPPTLDVADAAALYRPGEQRLLVGGDFFWCSQLPDGSVGLLIGDVAGHGPEAAAFAASLRAAWSAIAPGPLDELMARLNEVALRAQPGPLLFATALAGELSPAGQLSLCSAGHPPPLVVEEGRAREVEVVPGVPLGIRPDRTWSVRRTAVAHGSSLLLYTDGLVEGRRAPGSSERLGVGRICPELQRLHADGLAGADLLLELANFARRAHGAPLPDDVAALLVRMR
jgi:Stage II sporulation protein E (SpoIIE)/GAF domain